MPHRRAEGTAGGDSRQSDGDLKTYLRLTDVYLRLDPDDKVYDHVADALDVLWYRVSDEERALLNADPVMSRVRTACPTCAGAGIVEVPSEVETVEAYYFGCHEAAGHYWWKKGMTSAGSRAMIPVVGETVYKRIDGGFCPQSMREKERVAALHHLDGWTILAFWDRSVDRRNGSNSVFVIRGERDAPYALAAASAQFGQVFRRLAGPVTVTTS